MVLPISSFSQSLIAFQDPKFLCAIMTRHSTPATYTRIMTLTSTPCDLSTMSLFQDLKLKRRKIDSRCSSDGESIADTSTSSPDVVGPVSPSSRLDRSEPSPGLVISMDRMASSPECSINTDGGQDSTDINAGERVRVKEEVCEDKKDVTIASYENGSGSCSGDKTEPSSPAAQQQRRESVVMTSPVSCVVKSPPPTSMSWSHTPPSPRCTTPASENSSSVTQQNQQRRQSVVTSVSSAFWNATAQPPVPAVTVAPPVPNAAVAAAAAAASVLSVCRINGVRPELIGGAGFASTTVPPITDMKPPTAIPPRTTRSAPTVIMGEAGGVRTMIWSSPPSTVEQSTSPATTGAVPSTANSTPYWSTAATWSSTTSSSTTAPAVSEESAAHLLLNLGVAAGHDGSSVINHMPGLKPIGNGGQQTANGVSNNASGQSSFHVPLNMERLWAGDLSQLPVASTQQMHALNLTANTPTGWPVTPSNGGSDNKPSVVVNSYHQMEEADEQDQPMVCMICDDRATGLHYGIITCEGCKGFFKRTVQNRRIYTCIAEGTCEITKAQRNRCQYCRFKKCIGQGMVLQAVREDRMPGGRNSGAVYNLYKVKYKKKRPPKNGQVKMEKSVSCTTASTMTAMKTENQDSSSSISTLVNGTILKTALTNPSEVIYLRQRLDNAVSSSRDRTFSIEATVNMIKNLVDCDEFQDIATLRNMEDLLEHNSDLSAKLMQIGDSIVYKLVQWTKRLPFYLELPVEVHTRLLTHKWHELLVLTTSAYQAIHGPQKIWSSGNINGGDRNDDTEFNQEVSHNLHILQTCLSSMMGKPITMDQLRQDVGVMVEKITHVTLMFRRLKLRMEEYVCLKVIIMLTQNNGSTASELETIQERYTSCLKTYVEHTFPMQPNRLQDLLNRLPEIQSAASLLLESKMFYVPFLLNSTIRS
ncbi:hormone receptor 4 isoform X2 [Daktulosphaira vitifoliae]|uniref:hormone receptor 4 isoform X2 n=1 Tax=Daktulosphaira vitifoliae TaxID=58002 RepID=UPI0021AA590F|nr:hormone receptor 4 isoform X2 [Daktulosphaira vitifoliae]